MVGACVAVLVAGHVVWADAGLWCGVSTPVGYSIKSAHF